MPKFFFDLSHSGDVYHDAQGTNVPGLTEAKERAVEIVRRLIVGAKADDAVCTIRDINGRELVKIRIECVVPPETKKPRR
ncbi:hypothetical protein [Mesorhizobium sp. WSM3224]|uniref:DUF6894 family protein n=1 Tax=Mesorhizobium sp. WSM3224 TaxID=1040986 RepID=UPI00047F9BBB|nr:hypothetical protein [Mesorhizobium sp. WSM3224]